MDEAQRNLKEFEAAYLAAKEAGRLSPKQCEHYGQLFLGLQAKFRGYTHGDQKPDYKGIYREIK